MIFAAVYLLWMVQRVFFGKVTNAKNKGLTDLSWREIGLIAPLVVPDGLYGRLSEAVSRAVAGASVKAIQERVMHQAGGDDRTRRSDRLETVNTSL